MQKQKTQTPIPIEWTEISAGTFMMGSPSNEAGRDDHEIQHDINLSSFNITKYAITFEQYDAYCDDKGMEKPDDEGWGREKRPVINVSWDEANSFARWIGGRLPTEAEWEYACRAGTTTPFITGKNLTTLQANYDGKFPYNSNYNVKGEFREMTLPVGSFSPNAWGLYEMYGNVWEWCSDWYGDYLTWAQTNPQGPSNGSYRVYRGGSWADYAVSCRSAYRDYSVPASSRNRLGFRIVFPR